MTDGHHFKKIKNCHFSATIQATTVTFGKMMLGSTVNSMARENFELLKIQDGRQLLFKKF